MTRVAQRLGEVVTAVALAASAGYLIVYLYRWEWNRALVAASFLVAIEVALFGSLTLRRLRSIERRLDLIEDRPTLQAIRESAPAPAPTFRRLDERGSQLQVFIPVLLGAGVILSVMAAGVERVAGITATPVRERHLARRLERLQLPPAGLAAGPGAATIEPEGRRVWTRVTVGAFSLVVVGALLAAAVDLIADATMDRPDPPLAGRSEVVVTIEQRFTTDDARGTAEALVVACRHIIGHRHRIEQLPAGDDEQVRFVVDPAIGEHATRRFVGCVEDAQFDRALADVVSVRRVP